MTISKQVERLIAEKGYLQFTDYHKIPGGLKKLDFTINTLVSHQRKIFNSDGNTDFKILEVGCGNGNLSIPLGSLGFEVLGVDVDSDSIDYATRINTLGNVRFQLVGEQGFDFDEKFDVIICSEVLEHLAEPSRLIKPMISVLKDNGILIITIPNGYGPREVLGRLEKYLRRNLKLGRYVDLVRKLMGMIPKEKKHHIHSSNPNQEHVQKFTRSSIERLMLENGLKVSEKRNSFLLFSVFGRYSGSGSILDHLDCKLADYLPSAIVSGWYLICKKIL